MAELQAWPKHLASWCFHVAADGERITTLDVPWALSGGSFELDGKRFELVRAPNFGDFQLVGPMGVEASAAKPSAFVRRYAVEFGRRRWTLEAAQPIARRFRLVEDGAVIGDVAPNAPISRRCRMSWPDDVPRQVQVFLFWLVVLQWRRASQH